MLRTTSVAAAPVVLDLLGMDPNPTPSEGGGGGSNGAANGDGEGRGAADEPGGARPMLMLTGMAPLPSMMGPVGAARGAASEMAALCGEVRFFLIYLLFGKERGRREGEEGGRLWMPC